MNPLVVGSSLLAIGLLAAACSAPPARPPERSAVARTPIPDSGRFTCRAGSFELHSPPGWALDGPAGRAHGMTLAFRPRDATWDQARAVMFVRCHDRPARLAELVRRDKERFRRGSALVVLGEAEPLRTRGGLRIELRTLSGGPDGRNEATAYLLAADGALRIGLRAASQADFDAALPAFEALLGSLEGGD